MRRNQVSGYRKPVFDVDEQLVVRRTVGPSTEYPEGTRYEALTVSVCRYDWKAHRFESMGDACTVSYCYHSSRLIRFTKIP